jgi:hypothetical protein
MQLDIGDQAAHRPLVLGLGCERGTPCDEVIRLAEQGLGSIATGLPVLPPWIAAWRNRR